MHVCVGGGGGGGGGKNGSIVCICVGGERMDLLYAYVWGGGEQN